MKELKVTTTRDVEGTISAYLDAVPDGHITAPDAETLDMGIRNLIEAVAERVEKHFGVSTQAYMPDLGMQSRWTAGRFHVRWLTLPGFQVDFSTERGLSDFLKELALASVPGLEPKSKEDTTPNGA